MLSKVAVGKTLLASVQTATSSASISTAAAAQSLPACSRRGYTTIFASVDAPPHTPSQRRRAFLPLSSLPSCDASFPSSLASPATGGSFSTLQALKTPSQQPSLLRSPPLSSLERAVSSLSNLSLQQAASSSTVTLSSHSSAFSSSGSPSPPAPSPAPQTPPPLARASPKKVLSFDDPTAAYAMKSTFELMRAVAVFRLCSVGWIVANAERLLDLSKSVLGVNATMYLVKKTFFAHFCAGENADDIQPTILKLKQAGIGSILDYAAENDVNEAQVPQGAEIRTKEREGVTSARTYDYAGEQECDRNMVTMLECIDTAARQKDGVMAIKLTALGKPSLLQSISVILVAIRDMWHVEFAAKTPNGTLTLQHFKDGLTKMGVKLTDAEMQKLFSRFDIDNSGDIDFVEWTSTLKLEDMLTRKFFTRSGYNLSALTRMGKLPLLSPEETELADSMVKRLRALAESAARQKVRLLIDAEQTYLQPCIDHFAIQLQREFNKDFPVIYNTYQCYLKWSKYNLQYDLERARRGGYYFGAKLVRGAYMVLERRRAQEKGYPSPICDTLDETHANYNFCIELLLNNIDRANFMVASHNQHSVEHTLGLMQKLNIAPSNPAVMFGQLLGMADHLTFTLGQNGYRALKYVPYGPVKEVIAYLVRRAQENSDIMGNAGKEVQMMTNEVIRRLRGGKV